MTAPTTAAPQAMCPSFIGAKRMRVTLLDRCGRPIYGPKSQVVSKGFVSVEMEPEVEEGEDQTQKTAGGETCISAKGPDVIKWWTVSIEFCQVDPDMWLTMNRTWKPVTDATRSVRTGMRPALEFSDELGFALELWPKSAGAGAACDPNATGDENFQVSGYFLLPWLLGAAPESLTLENSPTTFTLKARTRVGSLWGNGPYNVTRDVDGNPAPLLDPIDPGFHVPAWNFTTSGQPDTFHIETVTVSPPEDQCGGQPLYNPTATTPTISVATGNTTRTAVLTVNNWAEVGNSGTVDWGDGTSEPVTGGTIEHLYDASADGTTQTVTFTAGNGAEPATATFTPTAPTVTALSVMPATGSITAGDTTGIDLTATATTAAGDTDVTEQATWTASPADNITVNAGRVTASADHVGGLVTITAEYAGATDTADITVTAA